MRRAAFQALRAARRAPVRRLLLGSKSSLGSDQARNAFAFRAASTYTRNHGPLKILSSAMYLRQMSVAALVSAVASGVWYYRAPSPQGDIRNSPTVTNPSYGGSSEVPPRRALIVEDDQFYVRELSSSAPLSKSPGVQSSQQVEMITPAQATSKLRRLEESYHIPRGRGVLRYDLVQLPSNNPIEDDHAEKLIEKPSRAPSPNASDSSSDWMFWSVFDGHSGWTTSAKLRQILTSFVARELNTTYAAATSNAYPSPTAIDAAIKAGFLKCDHEIVHDSVTKAQKINSRSAAAELLAPALSGSCALLSFYDSRTKDFRVACTGDSRAVLGRRGKDGLWTATALSEDQTGGTPSEMERLRKEHPDEQYVVSRGRILGNLEPSRAFGDASYKWARDVQEKIKAQWFGRTPPALLKTPPYVTAEPVVTTTKVEPEKGDFVVLATDGLWEMLTNEEVIGLVGRWLERNPISPNNKIHPSPSSSSSSTTTSWARSFLGTTNKDNFPLPVHQKSTGDSNPAGSSTQKGQRAPIRQEQWNVQPSDSRFVVEDKNVATHLVRNALGGRDRDMVCALLALPSPYSRRYRYVLRLFFFTV